MAKLGEQVLKRDARGWRVPRRGTKSLDIYRLMRAGKSQSEIHAKLGGDKIVLGVLMWRIRRPDDANRHARKHWHG